MRLDRPLPHAKDAERAVLGSVLIDPKTYDRVARLISASDFFVEIHRAAWSALEESAGRACDLLVLKEALRQKGVDDGGYLSSLVDGIPDVANVAQYAELVREKAQRRALIVSCHEIAAAAYDAEEFADLAGEAVVTFTDATLRADRRSRSLGEIGRESINRFEERHARGGEFLLGIPSGIDEIDNRTLGYARGTESIIGARPSVGKTAFALQTALGAAGEGYRTLLVELDMNASQIGNRLLAMHANVNLRAVQTGKAGDFEAEKVAEALRPLTTMGDRLRINFRTRHIAEISAEARRMHRDGGLDLLVVDHVGHVRGGDGEKRYLQLADVSKRLIDLAGELNLALLLLVQLNRGAAESEPALSDLRESGDLEQDARIVLLLDRPFMRGVDNTACLLNVKLAKNSEGESGTKVTLHYDVRMQRIEDTTAHCHDCNPLGGVRVWGNE